jgi:hypothetical protein
MVGVRVGFGLETVGFEDSRIAAGVLVRDWDLLHERETLERMLYHEVLPPADAKRPLEIPAQIVLDDHGTLTPE